MIKIVHIGDLHLGGNYPEKAAASIEFINSHVTHKDSPAFNPDLIVCTGDTTEKPLHVHSAALTPLLSLVTSVGGKMIFLQGTPSHEPYGFLENLSLATGHRVCVLDSVSAQFGCLSDWVINGTDKKIAIATVPALTRAKLQEWAQELAFTVDDPAAIIRGIMTEIGNNIAGFTGPKILLGHWTVSGCQTASGQTMFGADIAVGLEDIELSGANACMLGHIHKVQSWDLANGCKVAYCGSSYPCNWGELDKKSFNVWTFDEETGDLISLETVPFPHKPMVKVEILFTGEHKNGEWQWAFAGSDLGAGSYDTRDYEVKLCYSVPKEIASQIDDMHVRVLFSQQGVELAAIERVILAGNRERIADITSKETTRDQYLAVCAARQEEPRPGSIAKADAIDEQGVTV